MLRLKKKVRGVDLVEDVVGRFDELIKDLIEAKDECYEEIGGIEMQMQILQDRKDRVQEASSKATVVAENLRKILEN